MECFFGIKVEYGCVDVFRRCIWLSKRHPYLGSIQNLAYGSRDGSLFPI